MLVLSPTGELRRVVEVVIAELGEVTEEEIGPPVGLDTDAVDDVEATIAFGARPSNMLASLR